MWQRTTGAPKTRDFPKNGCSENGCSENEGFSKVARVWGRPSLRCIGFGCRDMWCLLVHFSATPHCPYPLTRVGCIWARYKLDFCLAFAASASLGLTTSQRPPDIPGRKGIIAESGPGLSTSQRPPDIPGHNGIIAESCPEARQLQ